MIKNQLHLAVAGAVALTSAAVFPQHAVAQDESYEEIVVTGSRIARDPLSTTGPITVVGSEAISQSGVSNVDDLLRQLPAMGTNGIGKNDNNGGQGLAWVDLRNLGSARTLVLVNGRRFVQSSSGVASAVDLNNIPVAMIERVEVLTDGASAVYGSDAVAGVINVVTKKSFEGTEVAVKHGDSVDGGGATNDISITTGIDLDRGSVVANLTVAQRDELAYSDRDWAGYLSSYHPNGNIYLDGLGMVQMNEAGEIEPGTVYDLQDMWLMGAQDRESVTIDGVYDLTDNVEAYVEMTYTQRNANQQLSGQPTYAYVEPMYMTAEQKAALDAYWAANAPADASGTWEDNYFGIYSRSTHVGPRQYEQQGQTYRALAGLKGAFDNGWDWEVYASTGRNSSTAYVHNSINQTNLETAIANGHDFIGEWSPELINAIAYTDIAKSEYTTDNFGAVVTGEFGSLPAGEVGVAIGAEYRKDAASFTPSRETQGGHSAGNQQSPTAGDYSVSELYTEFNLPILAGHKFAEELTVDAALRYSDYSSFGGAATYKLGAVYAPVETVRFRSSISTAFRAPTVYELYRGASQSYLWLTDPCSTFESADEVTAQCAADGLDENHSQIAAQLPANIGGNGELEAEEADTFTAGVVWTPSFADTLSITVDYYNIEIDKAIGSPDVQIILDNCYLDGDAAACAKIERDRVGQISNVDGSLVNQGFEKTSGIDFTVDNTWDIAEGELVVSLTASHLLRYDIETETGDVLDYKGYVGSTGGVYTDWRGLATVNYYADRWNAGARVRYLHDGVADNDFAVPSATYVNLNGGYMINDTLELTGGIDNVFNKKPPFTADYGSGYGELNGEYDFLGRYVWIGAKATF